MFLISNPLIAKHNLDEESHCISLWYNNPIVSNFELTYIPFLPLDCEIVPQVNVAKNKFHIKLKIPGAEMTELELGCNSDVQYGRWMAACRLAAKGKTMADLTYDVEVAGIKTFISMQRDNRDETDSPAVDNASIQCEDFVPMRMLGKMKSKQVFIRY